MTTMMDDDTELVSSSDQKMDDASTENPTVPQADPPSSDDSGDSDSDSDDDAVSNQQIETLESDLSSNPYNYDAYVQYIKLLRKTANLEKLRQAREAMSAIFPLSPSLWLEWARDEASLASSENVSDIVMLYERGLSDYQSVSLWCDYLNFMLESDPSVHGYTSDGISKMRSLFERAIPAAGVHVTEGNRIWEGYKAFEEGVLAAIVEADVEEKNKQIQRIRSIFHRHLSVPLKNLSSTLSTYKAWELEQGIDLDIGSDDLNKVSPQVAAANKKAQQMYSERAHLEEHISNKDLSDTEKFQEFMNYIKFEKTSGDPNRVQAIYERAVAEYPVSSDLWIDYTVYLDKTLKVGKAITHAYSRATRSCPWTEDLWARYLLALERGSAPEKEIYAVFEKSLQCTFSSFEEYLDLYLTRVDGLRRRMLSAKISETLDYSLIRETFQQASDYLMPHMQNTDSLLHLHAYWANLELSIGKDLAGARGVWDSFLKKSGGMLAAWYAYIDMEVHLGHVKEARSLYRRCYTRKFDGTGSEDICKGWLRFEREHGDLEDFDIAFQKVMPRLEELQLIRLQQESTPAKPPAGLKEHNSQKSTREKRKAEQNVEDESLAKRQKTKGRKVNEVDVGQSATVPNIKSENGKAADANKEEIEDAKPVKPKIYTDECTAFLSNLSVKVEEEDIRKFFGDVGGVDSIRILHHKDTGKPRGLAYVDFMNDEHLAAAIAKNRRMFFGKKISIARSNPKKGKKEFTRRGNDGSGNSKEPSQIPEKAKGETVGEKQGDEVQLKGKNTFAVPRNVKPLGYTNPKPSADGNVKPLGYQNPKPSADGNVKPLGYTNPKPSADEPAKSNDDVKPLGYTNPKPSADEPAKSNDEFRNMFLKK
ncbi:PREDICTED: squamous cell carcinoma antigen recognized by T-cells 3-like [Camelina sativa]|uniref:Squamous cell carcinoma antigen recognized by T-cells 3-like n=1 Tax=Camelina sativa TaxID=90675 RepID=A0ABM0UZI5_CAMSA|nr:PREDICTED: squamous cell carcinoma antigen recognized by T-cells 3-like [Camelina sativa]